MTFTVAVAVVERAARQRNAEPRVSHEHAEEDDKEHLKCDGED